MLSTFLDQHFSKVLEGATFFRNYQTSIFKNNAPAFLMKCCSTFQKNDSTIWWNIFLNLFMTHILWLGFQRAAAGEIRDRRRTCACRVGARLWRSGWRAGQHRVARPVTCGRLWWAPAALLLWLRRWPSNHDGGGANWGRGRAAMAAMAVGLGGSRWRARGEARWPTGCGGAAPGWRRWGAGGGREVETGGLGFDIVGLCGILLDF